MKIISLVTNRLANRLAVRFIALACCVALGLAVAACGPERNAAPVDNETLLAETERIAAEFVAGGNVEQARASLVGLGMANPEQWLLYATEESINRGASETSNALVEFADALGLQSAATRRYAELNGLTEISGEGVVETLAPVAGAVAAAEARADQAVANNSAAAPEAVEGDAEAEARDDGEASETNSSESGANEDEADEDEADEDEADEDEADEDEADEDVLESDEDAAELTSSPAVSADAPLNLRGGPGTNYNVVGSLQTGQTADVVARNPSGDWWQISAGGVQGWVYSPLVTTSGEINAVAVAADIPAAPPPTPAPVAQAPAPVAQAPAPVAEAPAPAEPAQPEAPAEAAPAEAAPVEEAPAEAAPPPASETPHFTMVQKRLWNKQENDGCIGKHLARVNVVDSNNVRLNGVTLQSPYTGATLVTGDQGKGEGIIEYDLHQSGDAFKVMTDHKGRAVSSDATEGATTRTPDIDQQTFIDAGYCSNDADCQVFYSSWGCHGHYSWEFTLQMDRSADQ